MWRCASIAAILAFVAGTAWPQASAGSVTGSVRNQTVAVIPGASVTLVNTATAVIATVAANQVGFYRFPGVVPVLYRLSAEVPGMQKYEATLTVQAQQGAVVDPGLRPGEIITIVEVKDVTPLITTDTAMLSSTLERARIEQWPTNGRTIATLLATLPGFVGQQNSS